MIDGPRCEVSISDLHDLQCERDYLATELEETEKQLKAAVAANDQLAKDLAAVTAANTVLNRRAVIFLVPPVPPVK